MVAFVSSEKHSCAPLEQAQHCAELLQATRVAGGEGGRSHVAMFGAGQAKFTCTAAFLMSVQPILMTQSKNDAGGFDYSVPLSTMLSELLKLGISMVMLVRSRVISPSGPLLSDEAVKEFFSFMVPGLIYFVNNNCLFFILQERWLPKQPREAL